MIGYTSGHNYEFVKKAVMYDHVNVVIWAFMDIVHATTSTSTDVEGERRRIMSYILIIILILCLLVINNVSGCIIFSASSRHFYRHEIII